jgi:DNA-binding PadR family transcriptional regulator
MSIKYAILGLLSWKPLTGYEMKKVFEESAAMYWSGNNNQIYKTLLQLLEEGLATGEVLHQEASPSKKIYTITEKGLAELKSWVLSAPEAPELRKTFLIQLAWADQLSDEELNELLSKYQNEIKIQLLIHQEKARRNRNAPGRNSREIFLWNKIAENLISSCKSELDWVQGIRKELFEKEVEEQMDKYNYSVLEKAGNKYLEFLSAPAPLSTDQDALDLVALCGDNDTNLLLLHQGALSEGFFRHKSAIAGDILQKLTNYRIKTAIVLSSDIADKVGFKGTVADTGRSQGAIFKVFDTREEAENWLLS